MIQPSVSGVGHRPAATEKEANIELDGSGWENQLPMASSSVWVSK
jgi:hypothetical protein